ncbi:MAG: hypothetical protein IJ087_04460, partial [Eggerthellaceae bacterium]|nr:hypothetical protein [Eggerthellaceae bacterium]
VGAVFGIDVLYGCELPSCCNAFLDSTAMFENRQAFHFAWFQRRDALFGIAARERDDAVFEGADTRYF